MNKEKVELKECGCNAPVITLTGDYGYWQADEEPYENGVKAPLKEEHEYLVGEVEFSLAANICTKCKQVFFYSEDAGLIGIDKLS